MAPWSLKFFSALVLALCGTSYLRAQSDAERKPKSAEAERFNNTAFRQGLKKRGLTELLELHLRDHPPTGRTETLKLQRDLKLAESADPSKSPIQRRAAVAEANRILEEIIAANAGSIERFEWRFALSHSLIYDEAEPLFTAILYRGGNAETRRRLRELTTRALSVLATLNEDIESEYDRIDNLEIREFERLERNGHVEALDRLGPRATYLTLWTLLYDSLSRAEDDSVRASRLNRILAMLDSDASVIETPHADSKVQVQALLLTGMAYRLLNDHPMAREFLERALAVASRLDDPTERLRIEWAVRLASIERIRNHRDDGRYEQALKRIRNLRRTVVTDEGDDFGLLLVAALLERSVYTARADAADDATTARRMRDMAWQPLLALIQRHVNRRDEVYATVCETIGLDANPAQLDPFERCALVAGLLFEADRQDHDAADRLARAIEVGEQFVADAPASAKALVPEALYNVAVALYRSDRVAEAAQQFLRVARDHSDYVNAAQAGVFAVQLASLFYEDPNLRGRPDVLSLYRDALEVLLQEYADTEAASYWRFYYAQLLEELESFDAAATQFALLDQTHEHYLRSVLSRLRCMARVLEARAKNEETDGTDLRHHSHEFLAVQREFESRLRRELARTNDPDQTLMWRSLLARATLLLAEVHVLPGIARPAQALDVLLEFEATHPALTHLAGRVWRVRLIAYEKLGRLQEAARAIPAYIASDPKHAGPALQSLYLDLIDDIERARTTGKSDAAMEEAQLALLLAQQVYAWSQQQPSAEPQEDRRLLIQLAQAHLHAHKYQRARELFEDCGAAELSGTAGHTLDIAVDSGYAEALYQAGDYAAALPLFNRLALQLPETDRLRWRALLRDLQCRTALKQSPDDVIKVIEQQKYLYPNLGGSVLEPQFDKLLRENQRRKAGE